MKMSISSWYRPPRATWTQRRRKRGNKRQRQKDWRVQNSFTSRERLKLKRVGLYPSRHNDPTHLSRQDSAQTQGLIQSLITKIINNVQVTIKNIHVRYEDKISVPGVRGMVLSLKAKQLLIHTSIHLLRVSLSQASPLCRLTASGNRPSLRALLEPSTR